MDDDDEEDESDDAIPEEAVIDKFLDMSTYIEPRSGKQAEIIQFMKVMLVQGYEIQSNVAMLRVQVKKMQADVDALKAAPTQEAQRGAVEPVISKAFMNEWYIRVGNGTYSMPLFQTRARLAVRGAVDSVAVLNIEDLMVSHQRPERPWSSLKITAPPAGSSSVRNLPLCILQRTSPSCDVTPRSRLYLSTVAGSCEYGNCESL